MSRVVARAGVVRALPNSLAVILVCAFAVGCHSANDGGGANVSPIEPDTSCLTTNVGPAGASVRHPRGGVLTIPAGALASNTLLSMCGASASESASLGGVPLGQGYRITPVTAFFLKPADLALPIDPTRLAPGAQLSHALVEWRGANGPIALQSSADLTSGLVHTQTLQTGDFAPAFTSAAIFIGTAPTLPDGVVGNAYSEPFSASGGSAPYTWTLAPNYALPPDLVLSSHGVLSGIPSLPALFGFALVATDGAGTSVQQPFTLTVAPLTNPAPVVTSISPDTAVQGMTATTVLVTGSAFEPSSQVAWDGAGIATTFVGETSLAASIPELDLASSGVHAITVTTPAPGGGTSASLPFTVTSATQNPVPALVSVSPETLPVSTIATQITVTGSNFVSSTVVTVGGQAVATQVLSSTEANATVPASDLATAGTLSIGVSTPPPGGGSSATAVSIVVGVSNPVPVLTSLAPTSVRAGSAAFTITVQGTGFVSGGTLFFGSTALATTVLSETEATGAVTAGLVAQAGTTGVTFVNPTPGGGASGTAAFAIEAVDDGGADDAGGQDAARSDGSVALFGDAGTFPLVSVLGEAGLSIETDGVWGGTPACVTFHLASGSVLPAGLVLYDNGSLDWPVAVAGRYTFDVTCEDTATPPNVARWTVWVVIASASASSSPPTITAATESALADGGQSLSILGGPFGFDSVPIVDERKLPYDPNMYVSATELVATVPARSANAGTHYVAVQNVAVQASKPVPYTVSGPNPPPVIDYVDPPFIVAFSDGGYAPPIAIHGSGLGPASSISISGGTAPRIVASQGTNVGFTDEVDVPFDPSELSEPQTISISVTNPAPGGGTSVTATINVVSSLPPPILSNLQPTTFSSRDQIISFTVMSSNVFENAWSLTNVLLESTGNPFAVSSQEEPRPYQHPVSPTTLHGLVQNDDGLPCGTYFLSASSYQGSSSSEVPFVVTCDDLVPTFDAGVADSGSGVASIAAGPAYTCARTGNGGVSCWGSGAFNGTGTSSSTPLAMLLPAGISQIGGGAQPCAFAQYLDPNFGGEVGNILCWNGGGAPAQVPGAVGLGAPGSDGLRELNRFSGSQFTTNDYEGFEWQGSGAASRSFTVQTEERRITASGAFCARYWERISCWGADASGELGGGVVNSTVSTVPVDIVPGIYDAWGLAASNRSLCALHRGGGVSCWGDDTYGELGNGAVGGSDGGILAVASPVDVVGLTDAIAIAGGGDHFCALRVGGTVVCWGYNADGALGDGTTTQRNVPTPVPGLTSVTAIATGTHHTCALRPGEVDCWGLNGSGEVGVPVTGSPVLAPTRAVAF